MPEIKSTPAPTVKAQCDGMNAETVTESLVMSFSGAAVVCSLYMPLLLVYYI